MNNLIFKTKPFLLSIAIFFLFNLIANGQTVRDEVGLFDKPDGVQSSAKIKSGTAIKILKRQGFWVEVDAGGKTGWLKVSMINISGSSGGPTAIDTGRLGTGNIVSTSAARGLSAKDLISGKPNFEEADKLEMLVVAGNTYKQFLTEGNVIQVTEKFTLGTPKSNNTNTNTNTGSAVTKKKGDDDW